MPIFCSISDGSALGFYKGCPAQLRCVQVFGGECDVFLGSLYINIGYVNASTTLNPDIQAGLASLGLSKISQVGLLHVSVGGSSNKHLDRLDFLPNLKVSLAVLPDQRAHAVSACRRAWLDSISRQD